MPFKSPFKDIYHVGDLIYGLNDMRNHYVDNVEAFRSAREHHEKFGAPPIYIDYYQIQREIDDEGHDSNYSDNPIYRNYLNSFFNHLSSSHVHNKYHDINKYRGFQEKMKSINDRTSYQQLTDDEKRKYNEQIDEIMKSDIVERNMVVGRKCKVALSWIFTSNSVETKDSHIHFILDGIEMLHVITKKTKPNRYGQEEKSITGKELRWIFRNRGDSRVAAKIQFWLDGKPVAPPWEFSRDIWNLWGLWGSRSDEDAAWKNYAEHVRQKRQNNRN
ncbi:hypothetical protein Xsto_00052 [Xenorhabdus stockiae]|uniref:T3SS effector EspK n=1 Tax=Xenorhabdus stockiae TaxID=351614 RepID=A0A2D0KWG7_9GAMM|nr:hypothetical protein [Xenorhabdus stockiae]PHM67763.1 hypothetical protein Xsto_00052 [Xenorhabdus stockiae]